MPRTEFNRLKKKALKLMVQSQHLFYRQRGRNRPPRRVLDQKEDRQRAMTMECFLETPHMTCIYLVNSDT